MIECHISIDLLLCSFTLGSTSSRGSSILRNLLSESLLLCWLSPKRSRKQPRRSQYLECRQQHRSTIFSMRPSKRRTPSWIWLEQCQETRWRKQSWISFLRLRQCRTQSRRWHTCTRFLATSPRKRRSLHCWRFPPRWFRFSCRSKRKWWTWTSCPTSNRWKRPMIRRQQQHWNS